MMTFTEAMNLVHKNPAGGNAVAVSRPSMKGFIYYDASKFMGEVEFGFRFTTSRDIVGHSYCMSIEDLNATDWYKEI